MEIKEGNMKNYVLHVFYNKKRRKKHGGREAKKYEKLDHSQARNL